MEAAQALACPARSSMSLKRCSSAKACRDCCRASAGRSGPQAQRRSDGRPGPGYTGGRADAQGRGVGGAFGGALWCRGASAQYPAAAASLSAAGGKKTSMIVEAATLDVHAVHRPVRTASLPGYRPGRERDSGKHSRPDARYWPCPAPERGHARMAQDSGSGDLRIACSANS